MQKTNQIASGRRGLGGIVEVPEAEMGQSGAGGYQSSSHNQSTLGVEVELMQKQGQELYQRVIALEKRLGPYLVPENQTPDDQQPKDPKPTMSPLAEILWGQNRFIEGVNDRLLSLIHRLED